MKKLLKSEIQRREKVRKCHEDCQQIKFHWACKNGHHRFASKILREGTYVNINRIHEKAGTNPLMAASRKGVCKEEKRAREIEILKDHIETNTQTNPGHTEVVRFLLANNANTSCIGKSGWNALMHAARSGFPEASITHSLFSHHYSSL